MIRKYAEIFCWKNVSSFCSAKATHIFSAKNIRLLYIESAKIVNKMTLNELVKLTTLWKTGPWSLSKSTCLVLSLEFPLSLPLSQAKRTSSGEIAPMCKLPWTIAVCICFNPCLAEWIKMPRPLLISSQSDYLIRFLIEVHIFNDKQCRSRSTDLDLHCLLRQGMLC